MTISSTSVTVVIQLTTRRVLVHSGRIGEYPRERQRVDGDGGGELRRLHPRRRAHEFARIDEERHAGRRPAGRACRAPRRSGGVGLPQGRERRSSRCVIVMPPVCSCLPSMLPLSTSIYPSMLTLSTLQPYDAVHGQKTRQDRYHHGDLSRALLQEALRTIQKGGVAALTHARGRRRSSACRARRCTAISPTSRRCSRPSPARDSARCACSTQEAWEKPWRRQRRDSRRWARPTCDLPSRTLRTTA